MRCSGALAMLHGKLREQLLSRWNPQGPARMQTNCDFGHTGQCQYGCKFKEKRSLPESSMRSYPCDKLQHQHKWTGPSKACRQKHAVRISWQA